MDRDYDRNLRRSDTSPIALTIAGVLCALFIGLLAFGLWPSSDQRTTVATDMSTRVDGSPSKPRTNPSPPAAPLAAVPQTDMKRPDPTPPPAQ